ncbi:lanosterol 14-alpha-demethylase [Crepidotus variabilis]|uniref:Lanosterol 14-alpha-demethylase n=1 Tax=Crepidotus variabilis TaxID=179855 RepID=A0A9P6E9T2_9AGAR|nr:lanosterol 14-alpha-demethylase [Crepidotus variabilis]
MPFILQNILHPISNFWVGQLAQANAYFGSSLFVTLILISSVILAIFLNTLRQLVLPRKFNSPPEVFHWLPFIGSAIAYGDNPLQFYFDCQQKYGDVFTFVLFGRRITVALGAQGNNFILGGKSTVFNAEDAYRHLTTPVFGRDVIYDVPNEVLMEQKKFIKVGLSADNLRSYVGMIEEEVNEFIKRDPNFSLYQENDNKKWGSFDVVTALSEITILTASRTLQGKEVRDHLDKSFADLYADLDGGFTPINLMFPNLPFESSRRRDLAQNTMSNFYVDIIKKRRASGNNREPDMIAALIEQQYRNGRALSDREIAHLMIALLMAGQHTSTATGSWTILHLAANPDVAEALYKEQVERFMGPDGKMRSPTYEDIRSLPVLDSVIRETLRMHPPIHSIMRYVREDVAIPATLSAPSEDSVYVIPKGNYVFACPAVSQTDPKIWKNSDKWEPYRWSDQEGVAAQAYKAYLNENGEKIDYGFGAVSKGTESPYQPFGAGKHRCIGEQFAYLQLGTIISTLVRAMELKIAKVPDHNYHTLIVMPKEPRIIHYRRRRLD